jgi:hypothetical protein
MSVSLYAAFEIGRCKGRSIDRGRIIKERIQRRYLAGTLHYFEQNIIGRKPFKKSI